MKILQASALVILGLFMAAGCTINLGSSSPNRIVSVETPLQQIHSSRHLENVEVTWKVAPSDPASTTEFEG
ncbi:MAG: hypothetical protein SFY68_11635, partial [Candidatus Sumerlaeia bacterium]|nr:hypothetical protein [Candidatus Sumerlaeia bacterium]